MAPPNLLKMFRLIRAELQCQRMTKSQTRNYSNCMFPRLELHACALTCTISLSYREGVGVCACGVHTCVCTWSCLMVHVHCSVSPGMADARNRLQEISNNLFEELATDVYDEVDRRETDAGKVWSWEKTYGERVFLQLHGNIFPFSHVVGKVWLATQQLQSSIAFLPVNPTLSPLRNQGRQKLATLNAEEFAQLVIDILLDTKRRQTISVETGE